MLSELLLLLCLPLFFGIAGQHCPPAILNPWLVGIELSQKATGNMGYPADILCLAPGSGSVLRRKPPTDKQSWDFFSPLYRHVVKKGHTAVQTRAPPDRQTRQT